MLIRRRKMLTAIGALLILTALVIGCSTVAAEPVANDVPVETEAALLHDDDEAGHDEADDLVSEEAHVDDHDDHDLPVEAEAVALHDDEAGHDEGVGLVSEEVHVDDHDAHDDDHDLDDVEMVEITLGIVEGRNWGFDPPILEVRVGTPVMLTLVNDGRMEHDVEMAGLMAEYVKMMASEENHEAAKGHHDMDVVAVHAIPGTTAAVMFTPMEAGEYEYACTLLGHKAAGMVGTLIVTN